MRPPKRLSLLWELAQNTDRVSSQYGHWIGVVCSIAAMTPWALAYERVYFAGIALALYFLIAFAQHTTKSVWFTLFKVLALNNVLEEAGLGDPTKITINEYITAVIIGAILLATTYKHLLPKWKNLKNE